MNSFNDPDSHEFENKVLGSHIFFLSTYLVFIMLDSVWGTGMNKLKLQFLMSSPIDAQELSVEVVLSTGWTMIGGRKEQFSLLYP